MSYSLTELRLDCNNRIKINFNGGELSSDAGLLLLKEFAYKIGFHQLLKNSFKTNDNSIRYHTDDKNLLQKLYQLTAGYFQDDDSDELTTDPVLTTILEKEKLASQPTMLLDFTFLKALFRLSDCKICSKSSSVEPMVPSEKSAMMLLFSVILE